MPKSSPPVQVRLRIEPWPELIPLETILARLEIPPRPFVLGDFTGRQGRFSLFSPRAEEIFEFNNNTGPNPLHLLDELLARYKLTEPIEGDWPFMAGWVGWFSYDLGRYIETLPDDVNHDIKLPLINLGFYDYAAIWDHQTDSGILTALEYQGQSSTAPQRLAQLRTLIEPEPNPPCRHRQAPPLNPDLEAPLIAMQRNIHPDDYLKKVTRAREYIHAGDIFEVNLSQRFAFPYHKSATALYLKLCERNPAAYAALTGDDHQAVVSASPEIFLRKRGREIITRPIKGTARRGTNAQTDQQNREALENSEKEQAELNMIIDLERNDLGRICEYGSVEVRQIREIEAHPTVFHAVSTITGTLNDDITVGQILRATFPAAPSLAHPKSGPCKSSTNSNQPPAAFTPAVSAGLALIRTWS